MDANISVDAKNEWAKREEAFDRTIERKSEPEISGPSKTAKMLSYFKEMGDGTHRLDADKIHNFISGGADLNARDSDGRTALDYVFERLDKYKDARTKKTGPYEGITYDPQIDPITQIYEVAYSLIKNGAYANALRKFEVESDMLFVKHNDYWYEKTNESVLSKVINHLEVAGDVALRVGEVAAVVGIVALPEVALAGAAIYVLAPMGAAVAGNMEMLGLAWEAWLAGQTLYTVGLAKLFSSQ